MMHLLYLDDAGSPDNTNETYFILGGVCVPEYSVRWLAAELEKLAITIDSAAPEAVEFHASAIFGGRSGHWRTYPNRTDRVAILRSVLLTLRAANQHVITFACAIQKAAVTGDIVQIAYEEISSRFDLYLARLNSTPGIRSKEEDKHRGLIIMDKTAYEASLQTMAAAFRRDGNRWGRQLRNIAEVPLFVDSKATRIIQLADHIAYAVFRRYNAEDLTYYNCIEGRFDQEDGVIHGLVHRKLVTQLCTCPACLSKANRPPR